MSDGMNRDQLQKIVDEHDTGGTVHDALTEAFAEAGHYDGDDFVEAGTEEKDQAAKDTEQEQKTDDTDADDETKAAPADAKAEDKADGDAEDATDESVPATEEAKKPAEDADQKKTDQAKDSEEADAAGSLTPPGSWSAEGKAAFADLPSKVQDEIFRREGDRERHFSQKMAQLSKTAQHYAAMDELLEPHRENFAMHGVNPVELFRQYIAYDKGMSKDPIGTIRFLAKKAGVDLSTLNPEADGEVIDPEIAKLRTQLDEQGQQISSFKTQQQQDQDAVGRQRREALFNHVDDFARTTDDGGKLKYPHFEELRTTMAALFTSAAQSGQKIDMDAAYEKALWASPSHRDVIMANQRLDAERKAVKEKKAHATKAAKAGSSVAGSPGGAEPSVPVGTVDEELHKAWNASS